MFIPMKEKIVRQIKKIVYLNKILIVPSKEYTKKEVVLLVTSLKGATVLPP